MEARFDSNMLMHASICGLLVRALNKTQQRLEHRFSLKAQIPLFITELIMDRKKTCCLSPVIFTLGFSTVI